jgi:hypothetical protein
MATLPMITPSVKDPAITPNSCSPLNSTMISSLIDDMNRSRDFSDGDNCLSVSFKVHGELPYFAELCCRVQPLNPFNFGGGESWLLRGLSVALSD